MGGSGRVLRRIVIACLIALLTAGPAGAGTIIVKLSFVPGKLSVKSAPARVTPAVCGLIRCTLS